MEFTSFGWVNNNSSGDKETWTSALQSFKCAAKVVNGNVSDKFGVVNVIEVKEKARTSMEEFIKNNKFEITKENKFGTLNVEPYKLSDLSGKSQSITKAVTLPRELINQDLYKMGTAAPLAGGAKKKNNKHKTKK